MAKRPEKTTEQPVEQEKKELVTLPLVFCRSSLFTATADIDVFYDNRPVYSTADWKVFYTGLLLRQKDLDVWLACLRLLKKSGIQPDTLLRTTCGKIYAEMGVKSPSGRLLKDLIRCIHRLMTALVKIEGPIMIQRRHLIVAFDNTRSEDGKIEIKIDPLFAPLLDNYTVNSSLDNSLKMKRNMSKWLYRYATTCEGEFRISVKKLRELSGNSEDIKYIDQETEKLVKRKAKPYKEFRRVLSEAIDEILEIIPEEFEELRLADGGEDDEGQVIIVLSERPQVLINKNKKSETSTAQPQLERRQRKPATATAPARAWGVVL